MNELDAGAAVLGDEAHVDLRFHVHVELEIGIELPREREASRRIPRHDVSPYALRAVDSDLEHPPTDARLDPDVLRVDLSDVMGRERPPRAHLLREDVE